MRCLFRLLAALALMAPGLHGAHAEVVTLTFEGAGNLARLNGFYGGGSDSQGHVGPDFGVVFGPTALSIIDEDVGTGNTGNFGNEPSPDTVLFFLTGPAVLNYSAGFSDGFSFFYSTTTFAAQVRVFDGLDAGGNLIGTIALRALGEGPGDPTGSFSNWEAAGLAFAGTARSIVFDGTADRVAFDNVTFGSATPTVTQTVAEPSTLALLGLALVGSAVVAGRRGRADQAARSSPAC